MEIPGVLLLHHLLRRARDDFAALDAAFRAEVDDPVRGLDDIEIVLDHHHGVALLDQPWSTSSSLRTSSKCRPVVGSSRM
jgi:hypothetical protein